MPKMDGFETSRRLRALKGVQVQTIVMITGVLDGINVVRARESGSDEFCVKTTNNEQLVNTIKFLL